jgi:hypothetical protein
VRFLMQIYFFSGNKFSEDDGKETLYRPIPGVKSAYETDSPGSTQFIERHASCAGDSQRRRFFIILDPFGVFLTESL